MNKLKLWTEYVVVPFSGKNTGKHRKKQSALEDAQTRAINSQGESFVVYRVMHYTDSDTGLAGMCDLIPVITYWFDGKLQYQEA